MKTRAAFEMRDDGINDLFDDVDGNGMLATGGRPEERIEMR
jgi:hypothetical protein